MTQLKRRLPLLLMLGIGLLVWKGGFGLWATDRTLVFRLPVSAVEVRAVEIQIFEGETLLKREELNFPSGLQAELQSKLPMTRGPHRALVWVKVAETPDRRLWKIEFDPTDQDTVIIAAK